MLQRLLNTYFLPVIVLFSLSFSALAGNTDAHREHSAHEHGHATLNFVQENKTVQFIFESPAVNIVGFEHEPENEEDHRKVADAISLLKQGEKLFIFTAEAQCTQTSVEIETALVEEDEDKDEHHEDHQEQEGHSEFAVTYEFRCEASDVLNSLTVMLFEYFPQIEEVDSQLVIDSRQFSAELSPENPSIKL